jgi:8-oxo-dGTP diphosphatase
MPMNNKNKLTRIAQKVILLRKDGKILTIRRSITAPTRPLQWDLPGGMLDFGEDPKVGIIREIREETGLKVNELSLFDTSSKILDSGEFRVVICYTAFTTKAKVVLSYEHDDLKWVTPQEFLRIKASPTHKKFVRRFISLRKNNL